LNSESLSKANALVNMTYRPENKTSLHICNKRASQKEFEQSENPKCWQNGWLC